MNPTTRILTLISTISLMAAACGPTEPATCEQARDHVQACFPDQEARVPDSCDESAAADILDKDCDALAAEASAAAGAADGACNPFYWWLCGSGTSSDDEPEGYSFRLGINVCETEICTEDLFGEITSGAECGKITLENERGEVVATDYINERLTWGGVQGTGGGFDDLDLEPGSYTARLWRRDGELATTVEAEPAEIAVTLLDNGAVETDTRNFRILRSEADDVRACADVQGTLTSSCDGELQSKEDAEWSWLIQIEGTNSEGTYENLKRSGFVYSLQSHSYLFPRVRAGSYTLRYIEVDISSSYTRRDNNNAKFEDYLELADRYATGAELTDTIEITEEQIAASEVVQLVHLDLETGVCL